MCVCVSLSLSLSLSLYFPHPLAPAATLRFHLAFVVLSTVGEQPVLPDSRGGILLTESSVLRRPGPRTKGGRVRKGTDRPCHQLSVPALVLERLSAAPVPGGRADKSALSNKFPLVQSTLKMDGQVVGHERSPSDYRSVERTMMDCPTNVG